jgi:hypothetical protein
VFISDTFLVLVSLISVLWLPIAGCKVGLVTSVDVVNKKTVYFVGGLTRTHDFFYGNNKNSSGRDAL